ncbi:hypothetical protein NG895_25445 [Aeoliella sp. ICT_H6.2]|uniref:PEP-CTERM protein-sorting domain-containing protein n=1 Tax=Aeoliella straminimaris TaxID=2954799 RepID=A0A9X2FEK6_9BACT|nr:hypothetical protein [Aeoliella straminimaris]MCO6047259.1 hypothetical protein [Aeoliella straminimaris]
MYRLRSYVGQLSLVALILLVAGPAEAVEQALNLELLPPTSTTNRVNISVSSSGLSDTELTRVTGNSLATIGYDIYEGLPLIHSIAFTGGHISLLGESSDNVTLSDSNLISNFSVVGSGLGGELDTPNPPGPVSDGTYNTADHIVRINTGTLAASGSFLFVPFNYDINLDQDPLDFTTESIANIDVSLVGTNGRQRTYEVVTSLPIDATEVIEDAVTITVDVQGTVTSSDTFSIFLPLEGDYNGDNRVDIADYTVWRNTLGATGAGLAADGNFDWVVDEADYTLWKDNFSETSGGLRLASVTVPEPSAAALVAIGVMAFALAGRMRAYGPL